MSGITVYKAHLGHVSASMAASGPQSGVPLWNVTFPLFLFFFLSSQSGFPTQNLAGYLFFVSALILEIWICSASPELGLKTFI
jgi:hypothetical protein